MGRVIVATINQLNIRVGGEADKEEEGEEDSSATCVGTGNAHVCGYKETTITEFKMRVEKLINMT